MTSAVRIAIVVLALAASGAACENEPRTMTEAPPPSPSPTTISLPTSTATTPRSTTTAPSPVFTGEVLAVDDAVAARMTASWRPGCPVPHQDLQLLTLSHWDFAARPAQGELVVHADVADDVVEVFRALFDARFPVERMRLVDEYGGDDDRSMAANNTSAFNCRVATGSSRWSEHAYGRAIDINPVQNPYVTRNGSVLPPAGGAYVDRTSEARGLISADGPVVQAFDAIGWGWGGSWTSARDYQHFSASGR